MVTPCTLDRTQTSSPPLSLSPSNFHLYCSLAPIHVGVLRRMSVLFPCTSFGLSSFYHSSKSLLINKMSTAVSVFAL